MRKVNARHAQRRSRMETAGGTLIALSILLCLTMLGVQAADARREAAVGLAYAEQTRSAAAVGDATLEAERLAAESYNETLAKRGGVLKPLKGDGSDDAVYQSLLDYGGMMAVVRIPSIGVSLPVYHGTGAESLEAGAGHLYGTSLPVGGLGSHSVLAAHRGLPGKLMFTRLGELAAGDVFYVDVLGESHEYVVDRVSETDPSGVEDLFTVDSSADFVSLLTCTPYGVNTRRLVVRGVRVSDGGAAADGVSSVYTGGGWVAACFWLSVGLAACMAGLVLAVGVRVVGWRARVARAGAAHWSGRVETGLRVSVGAWDNRA